MGGRDRDTLSGGRPTRTTCVRATSDTCRTARSTGGEAPAQGPRVGGQSSPGCSESLGHVCVRGGIDGESGRGLRLVEMSRSP